jgi:hypothetical protein
MDEAAVAKLRTLAKEWLGHHEYNETDDPSNDTGAENDAYNACGAALNDLLDDLTGVPRCRACGQHINMHEATGLWTSSLDVTLGACWMNYRRGANESDNGRHVPRG